MVTSRSGAAAYLTAISNGTYTTVADTSTKNGGGGAGFRPHELLEAALAACIDITLRMVADREGIPLEEVATKVEVVREDETAFEYEITFKGQLDAADRRRLLAAAERCPVRRTLSKPIVFRQRSS